MRNASTWLRIAAVLMLIHGIGHTIGMLSGPSHGPEEVALIDTMKAHRFDMMGTNRSYWDFFLGFGYDASISIFLQTVVLWLLADVAKTSPAATRPFIAMFLVAWVACTVLYVKYFFIAPIIFAAVMVIVFAIAWLTARKQVPGT